MYESWLTAALQKMMTKEQRQLPAKHTLLLILLPMLATFLCLRLYLHLVHVRHIYPGGYLVHHLFIGVLIVIPAAFTLAFGARLRSSTFLALVALGVGSALVLDEVIYLVATKATNEDYVSPLSLHGAMFFMFVAVLILLALFKMQRN